MHRMEILWKDSPVLTGTKTAIRWWKNTAKTEMPSRGFVILIHGLGEHIGRYHELAAFLCPLGFDVLGLDHAGHGLSKQEGGQKRITSIFEMVDEYRDFKRWWNFEGPLAKKRAMQAPWYLVGHSMGALVGLTWILQGKKNEVEGDFAQRAFLSALPLKLRLEVAGWKLFLAQSLNRYAPDLKLSNEIDPSMLSYDAANVAAYRVDKLVHGYSSPRSFISMLEAAKQAFKMSADLEIPVCFAVGKDDPIVDVSAVRGFYDMVTTQKSYLEFPHMKHEIFNEVNRQQVYQALASWMM
jgi:lysophospholipase